MVGDGQEHVDRPIYDDDGEMIVWPTLDEDMEEFAEEPEVATVAASGEDATEDDTYYEVPDTVEDDQDRIEVQIEGIEDEQCEDAKIGDIQQAGEEYDQAMDRIVAVLMQALSTEEMTEEMSAELQDATNNLETAKQTITDLCGDPETKALQTDPDTKIPQNLQELLETLTKDGKAPWLYVDDEGNLLLDGEQVPKLKVIELEAEKIKADVGEFKDLTTQNFTATNATITNLKSDYGQFKELTTNNFTASNGKITTLESNLASIQTLVGGHLTMDNIQSLVLTSSKVTIADALIKDAMIDTVSANKINTGTINTNNVNIQSDDGSMLLQGNLQQFKDSKGNVRIQLGKDAKGNFTFVLYDETGKGQLINQNGIQSSNAIKDGLIVDSKVADNANISGSKLDISSVISSINNNTNTIQASHIKFSDTDQTLDVSFNQLKKTVETIKDVTIGGDLSSVIEQVSTNTTNIGIAQGQISTLISNTTITKQDGTVVQLKDEYNSTKDTVDKHTATIGKLETNINDVTSRQTSLEQNLDGFKTTVSNAYTTKVDFNNLQVGARNYLVGTKNPNTTVVTKMFTDQTFFTYDPYSTYNTKTLAELGVVAGDKLTVSLNYEVTKATTYGQIRAELVDKDYQYFMGYAPIDITATSTSGRYVGTITLDNKSINASRLRIRVDKGLWTLKISNVKLEKGSVATSWTPAPEDIDNNINNISVGGRNLIKNSAFNGTGYWSIDTGGSIDTTKKLDWCNSLKMSIAGSDHNGWKGAMQRNLVTNVKKGDVFTVSGYYFVQDKNTLDSDFACELKGRVNDTDVTVCNYTRWNKDNCVQGQWTYFYYVATINQNVDSLCMFPWVQKNGTVWVAKLKVEKGNKPTDWSPAAEDTNDAINSVDGKFKNYSTTAQMNSAITQKANEISTSVSETYTAKADFNNLSIGGRNFLVETKDAYNMVVNTNNFTTVDPYVTYNSQALLSLGFKVGDKITVSFDWSLSNVTTAGNFRVETVQDDTYKSLISGPHNFGSDTSGRYVGTKTLTDVDVDINKIRIRVDVSNLTMTIKNMKLEKGDRATSWTPAIEDIDKSINVVDGKFVNYSTTTQMNSAINQKADQITSTVSKTYATKTSLKEVKESIENLDGYTIILSKECIVTTCD